jgi:hypothetical protein
MPFRILAIGHSILNLPTAGAQHYGGHIVQGTEISSPSTALTKAASSDANRQYRKPQSRRKV